MSDNRIETRFTALAAKNKTALVAYLVAGDPNIEASLAAMHCMVEAGVDVIEVGVPFSDPSAEGPSIQRGHERALANKVGLRTIFQLIAEFRNTNSDTPIVLMGYTNPIEWMGIESFAQQALQAGVDGVLTVDLPPEEAHGYTSVFEKVGLVNIFLIAPTTSDTRMQAIGDMASGFLYYVSLKGVTGSAKLDVAEVKTRVAKINQISSLPVCVGFGIKNAESAAAVADYADGVVIGSAIVDLLSQCHSAEQVVAELKPYLSEIRQALD
jgi:tryptophan synthase alpha chain